MSAYIVDKRHIDALVTLAFEGPKNELSVNVWGDFNSCYMMQAFSDEPMTPDELGRILWQTNHDSVNARYNESEQCPEYVYERGKVVPTTAQAINLLSCYEYQSCEHGAWIGSPAFLFCGQLLSKLARHMPAVRRDNTWDWGEE